MFGLGRMLWMTPCVHTPEKINGVLQCHIVLGSKWQKCCHFWSQSFSGGILLSQYFPAWAGGWIICAGELATQWSYEVFCHPMVYIYSLAVLKQWLPSPLCIEILGQIQGWNCFRQTKGINHIASFVPFWVGKIHPLALFANTCWFMRRWKKPLHTLTLNLASWISTGLWQAKWL